MGLEVATTIAQLNAAWPLGTDPRSQGDDHLRLVKAVMKNDALSKAAGGTLSAALTIANITPALRLLETDAVSPLGQWEFQGSGGGSFGFVRHTVASFGGAANYFRAFPDNGTLPDRMSFDVAATFNSSVTADGGATLGGLRVGVDTPGTIRKNSADMVLSLSAGGFLFRIGDVVTGPFVARVEAAGTAVPQPYSIVTREKGDARYAQLAGATMTGPLTVADQAIINTTYIGRRLDGSADGNGISTTGALRLTSGATTSGSWIRFYDASENLLGRFEAHGTAAGSASTIITREKGDLRYAPKALLLEALQALPATPSPAQLLAGLIAGLQAAFPADPPEAA